MYPSLYWQHHHARLVSLPVQCLTNPSPRPHPAHPLAFAVMDGWDGVVTQYNPSVQGSGMERLTIAFE